MEQWKRTSVLTNCSPDFLTVRFSGLQGVGSVHLCHSNLCGVDRQPSIGLSRQHCRHAECRDSPAGSWIFRVVMLRAPGTPQPIQQMGSYESSDPTELTNVLRCVHVLAWGMTIQVGDENRHSQEPRTLHEIFPGN